MEVAGRGVRGVRCSGFGRSTVGLLQDLGLNGARNHPLGVWFSAQVILETSIQDGSGREFGV